MSKGIKLFRIGGINIEIDFSWFFIAAFITLTIAGNPALQETDLGGGQIFLVALLVAVFFFGSLLLHELAHSFAARSRGIEVTNIRLFVLGGVSNIKKEPRTPFEEFYITVVGPLTSALLGGLFLGIQLLVGSGGGVVYWAAGYLAFANLALAIFNMLPAYPLDGGRVLHSIIWGVTKNNMKATKISGIIGQGFAALFIAGGVFLLLDGWLFNGLMFMFLGYYLWSAAKQSYGQLVAEKYLKEAQVGQVMSHPIQVMPANTTVGEAVQGFFMLGQGSVLPVVEEGYLLGLVTDAQIRKVPATDWATTRLVEIMQRRGNLEIARPTESLEDIVKRMTEKKQAVMPVLNSEGYFVGLLTLLDVTRYLQIRQRFGDNVPSQIPVTGFGMFPQGTYNPNVKSGTYYNPAKPQNPYGDNNADKVA
jgi:Zn-dependent protease/CBS domain-containing protein